nr:reverse transcriptase domain-containing protein [Tanacetum cinerariifolium]
MKAVTTRSGLAYEEPDVLRTQSKPSIPYPSRLNDQKLREKATNQMEKFFQIFHDLHFDISFADALLLMPKFASTIKSLLANKDKLFELAKVPLNERCSAMFLKKLPEKLRDPGKFLIPYDFLGDGADPRVPLILGRSFLRTGRALIDVYGEEITLRYNLKSSNPTLVSNDLIFKSDSCKMLIVKSSSLTLTPFGESDFSLDEIEDFMNDDSIPTRIENPVYDSDGDILFFEKLLNEDPCSLLPMDLKLAKNLKVDEREALLNVLKSHKQGIAWKISDIKGIDPRFCTYKILMEDDYKPAVQSQRRKKLTEAPILVVPDWNLPFELMYDASDYAIGAVLGQRKSKHFQPICYAIKTMTEAQIHYTTTKKEMLAVVYAFENF